MRKVLVGLVSVGLMLEMLCACGSQTEKVIQNEVNNEKCGKSRRCNLEW